MVALTTIIIAVSYRNASCFWHRIFGCALLAARYSGIDFAGASGLDIDMNMDNMNISTNRSSTGDKSITGSSSSSGSRRGGRKDGSSTAPLDSLSRGCLGTEVAALVNTLRIHALEIQSVGDSMKEAVRQLTSDHDRQLKALQAAKISILNAAGATLGHVDEISASLSRM
jgi:hypothetical protein